MFTIHIANRQKTLPIDRRRIQRLVRAILGDAGFKNAQISIAVVDDRTISELHDRFMNDATPTDVLSFVLEQNGDTLEGEVVVSADTAVTNSKQFNTTAAEELLLYVIHGTLHLAGYDDTTPQKRKIMRKQEQKYLALK